ncbi:MAG: DUF4421 family protein [Capnocytophaga sp.]|nr:DUF4421 family protein [Capnocytophaga sp.]
MKKIIFFNLYFILFLPKIFSQEIDTIYIKPYPQRMWIKPVIPIKFITLRQGDERYIPNIPLNAGVGLGLRKIIGINLYATHSIFPMRNDSGVSSEITDFQMHMYGRKLLVDVYYQDYKGFFREDTSKKFLLFPTMRIKQTGVELTYLFNGEKYSARAAYEQSELQIKSAGSFSVGGGFYWHRIVPDDSQESIIKETFENGQIGVNIGYAHSFVINKRWLLSGFFSAGLNFGNEADNLKKYHLKIYPTNLSKMAIVYTKDDWAISISGIFNTNILYPSYTRYLSLHSPYVQLIFYQATFHF